jgi:UDP-N-acetylglucosamine diphosphorylase / glucose-1-phosphate thymidylyltransferase / UDP-N-acetylgalactosamine diphosphorylase / glucosamine-1-phosphate N-acetyltransferase / galactosamine-1-phosphate N-acetyltransferase
MKSITLFEDEGYVGLLPLVYWRSVFELRVGRKIVLDRTAQRLGLPVSGVWTRHGIARVAAQRCGAPANQGVEPETILVNGRWLPNGPVDFPRAPCVGLIDTNVVFIVCDEGLARSLSPEDLLDPSRRTAELQSVPKVAAPGTVFHYPWNLVSELGPRLNQTWSDADASNEGRVDPLVIGDNANRLHIGEGTVIHPTAVLDPTGGPIYISHDVRIGAYCVIEGPAYIGPGTAVHPHAWLHGGNAIGPMCKIGGEVDGCIIDGYTNKQHEGFLGHSYVGCWVNIGAGATNSDLKNTYGRVRVPVNGREVDTGLQFFGTIIGDHAKIGINATIPTGAMIGFASVINAAKTAPKYVPSFSWVTDERMGAGDPNRLLDLAAAVLARRNVDMSDDEVELFLELHQVARQHEARA